MFIYKNQLKSVFLPSYKIIEVSVMFDVGKKQRIKRSGDVSTGSGAPEKEMTFLWP